MADRSSKPAIPAWQRAQPPQSSTPAAGQSKDSSDTATPENTVREAPHGLTEEENVGAPGAEESVESVSTQLEQVDALLQDESIKGAPVQDKRAFLKSKDVPVETIDQLLERGHATFSSADFDSFRQQKQEHSEGPAIQPRQIPSGPPIITYPEYLVDAHKPPPLITPRRIVNATYVAGGIATLIYAASKYIVTPMIDGLTEARHDFASHSQGKLDDFNDRLAKIVSKLPEPKDGRSTETDNSEIESVTSDPTELYHRDMGTQTSPLPSRRSSSQAAGPQEPRRDPVTYQSDGLAIIKSHLSELADAEEKSSTSIQDRQDSINKLRHYLDTLMYASPAISVWSTGEDTLSTKSGSGRTDDTIEELKKEIRGVKGVLLSARRFPSAKVGA